MWALLTIQSLLNALSNACLALASCFTKHIQSRENTIMTLEDSSHIQYLIFCAKKQNPDYVMLLNFVRSGICKSQNFSGIILVKHKDYC